MAWKRMVLQIGMGTDIRGVDYTKAAVRALRDALWHNALSVADALGQDVDSMRVEVTIGVPKPEQVDKQAVLDVLPHGTGTVTVVQADWKSPTTPAPARPCWHRPPRWCGWTFPRST